MEAKGGESSPAAATAYQIYTSKLSRRRRASPKQTSGFGIHTTLPYYLSSVKTWVPGFHPPSAASRPPDAPPPGGAVFLHIGAGGGAAQGGPEKGNPRSRVCEIHMRNSPKKFYEANNSYLQNNNSADSLNKKNFGQDPFSNKKIKNGLKEKKSSKRKKV